MNMILGEVKYKELKLKSADGTNLFAREWKPANNPKAWIAMSHGQSEHSGRYDYLGRALVKAGYAMVMADLHGHGQSGGKRGHVDRFSQYADDLKAVVDYIKKQNLFELFIGGHSLGALNAARIAVDNPPGIKGVFLSGAALRLGFDPPGWKVTMGKIMSNLLPGLTMGNELDVADLTHNLEIVELQRNDPYNHGKISTRAFVEFINTQKEVLEKARYLKIPILIMHGDQDKLSALSGSRDFYEAVGSKEKALKIYEGFYHEIFNELDRDRVIYDLVKWLDALTDR